MSRTEKIALLAFLKALNLNWSFVSSFWRPSRLSRDVIWRPGPSLPHN